MGGFVKLQSSILQSTVWREPNHIRILWITVLAMKDRNGIVEASIPGLADAARITLDECEEGLTRLSSPDRYSRTKDHDGRRIQEIDGGWIVLNHEKYRGDTSTERVRKHREAKLNETQCNVSSFQERCETKETRETASDPDPDQIQIRSRSEDPKIKKKSRAAARSSSKSSPLEVLSLAQKYLDIFNAVFRRKCGARSMVERKIVERLEKGTPVWQTLCAPILQMAIDPNTGSVRNFGPEMLLRDGSRRRQGENGATYGGTDWIERIYMVADSQHLDERLTAIATHFELTEHIRRTGATLADTTR